MGTYVRSTTLCSHLRTEDTTCWWRRWTPEVQYMRTNKNPGLVHSHLDPTVPSSGPSGLGAGSPTAAKRDCCSSARRYARERDGSGGKTSRQTPKTLQSTRQKDITRERDFNWVIVDQEVDQELLRCELCQGIQEFDQVIVVLQQTCLNAGKEEWWDLLLAETDSRRRTTMRTSRKWQGSCETWVISLSVVSRLLRAYLFSQIDMFLFVGMWWITSLCYERGVDRERARSLAQDSKSFLVC